jgi:hypothetical protein
MKEKTLAVKAYEKQTDNWKKQMKNIIKENNITVKYCDKLIKLFENKKKLLIEENEIVNYRLKL